MLFLPGFGGAEAELSWFFGEGPGLLGGQSCMGPMLERASMYHVAPAVRRATPRESVTAWPACTFHRDKSSDGWTPDDGALARFGRVSRRLRDAGQLWPDAPALLQAYYSDEGDRFGRTRIGRMGALLRFTSAGKRLIEKQRAKERGAKLKGISDAMRIENSVAQVGMGIGTAENTQSLLGQGLTEARALLTRALEAYTGRSITPCQDAAE